MSETGQKYQLMPALTEKGYLALKDDIRLRGVLVPIEFDELGNILDGHHRLRIVEELRAEGIRIDYQSIVRPGLTEREKRAHVRAINLQRRHLNQEQCRQLIADQLRDTLETSDRRVASALRVSPTTVGRVRERLVANGDVSRMDTGLDSRGRNQPSGKPSKPGAASVVALSEKESQRAMAALLGMRQESIPSHAVSVKLIERIRREADSADRALGVEDAPSVVGNADIRLGDFRCILNDIADGSADLIVTDPAYSRESLPLWGDPGAFAVRTLRPGGLLVTYSGQAHLPDVFAHLTAHLQYIWIIAQVGPARKSHDYNRHVYANWKPILVFAKPPFTPDKWFDDLLRGDGPEKDHRYWQQGEGEARSLVEMFSRPGDLILDAFLGSGTTAAASIALGRRFVGCDIDPVAVGVESRKSAGGCGVPGLRIVATGQWTREL